MEGGTLGPKSRCQLLPQGVAGQGRTGEARGPARTLPSQCDPSETHLHLHRHHVSQSAKSQTEASTVLLPRQGPGITEPPITLGPTPLTSPPPGRAPASDVHPRAPPWLPAARGRLCPLLSPPHTCFPVDLCHSSAAMWWVPYTEQPPRPPSKWVPLCCVHARVDNPAVRALAWHRGAWRSGWALRTPLVTSDCPACPLQ